jgi:low temperature requirement protein LtrA
LLFDLVFVVAVSFAASTLHELEQDGRAGQGTLSYLIVFAAIWWAWMTFTWFATAFDTDDWLYRVATLVQMGGALVIAAGVVPAMTEGDITLLVVGYLVMRFVAIPQWLRVAVQNPEYRVTALRYAAGIAVVQSCWLLLLGLGATSVGTWVVLPVLALEFAVPPFAERARPTPWHPHHVAERFGLFTLILLGESILASATAIIAALGDTEHLAGLIVVAISGLIVVAAMWWVYFARPMHTRLSNGLGRAMVFGYFHYVIFAAAGAVSAGIEVAVGTLEHGAHADPLMLRCTLVVPVAAFFLGVWWLALRPTLRARSNVLIVALCAIMGTSAFFEASVIELAVCAAAIVVVVERGNTQPPESAPER